MSASRRSANLGIALLTVGAMAIAPTVQPSSVQRSSAPAPQIQLVVDTSSLAPQTTLVQQSDYLPTLLAWAAQKFLVPPSAGKPFPTPQFPPQVTPTSIGSTIIWTYNAIEPLARYLADVAAYVVGWIPYVGWLAPQITIFYNFGERIARSITYNIAFWLDGQVSFGQGLINVGIDTINSFIQLGFDQLYFWLPPLPPLPPFPLAATQAPSAPTLTAAANAQPAMTPTAPQPVTKPVAEPTIANVVTSEAPATQVSGLPALTKPHGRRANASDALANSVQNQRDVQGAGAPDTPTDAPNTAGLTVGTSNTDTSSTGTTSTGTSTTPRGRITGPNKGRVNGAPSGTTTRSNGAAE